MAKEESKKTEQDVQKVEPAHSMSPFEQMNHLFEDYLSHPWPQAFRRQWPSFPRMETAFKGKTPSVDIIERDDEIIVKAELPGVDKKDLDVSVTSNTVTIKGSTHHEEKEEKGDYYRCEISRGSYSRTLPLPADVDETRSKASFKDGILELTIPKIKKSKRHTVKVD